MERTYDLVLLGATGHTGQFAAEYITQSFPSNFNWAIAGRSQQKLSNLARDLREINPDRSDPAVEVVQLVQDELHALAGRTRVLVNTVGPYHLYSEPVVEACATNGTHYVDVTGETPWVVQMIEKYHDKARSSGAIIIPQCGLESSPPDILSYALVKQLSRHSLHTKDVFYTIDKIQGLPSGGTLATVLELFNNFGIGAIQRSLRPGSMCPAGVRVPQRPRDSWFTRVFGVREVPDLGMVTTSLFGAVDVPVVMRSWGLFRGSEAYGENFSFKPYQLVNSTLKGSLIHLAATIGSLPLIFPPIRWLMRKLVYKPGEGPTREQAAKGHLSVRALAIPDSPDAAETKTKAAGSLNFSGGMYQMTAVLVCEAAATILDESVEGEVLPARELGGGLLTPATLGMGYVERLRRGGVAIETGFMGG
ncbi:MAG: hypothetical protein M1831_002211 [Alyxoria varia]|nr:MAG: hypothetical protein M1831_002211 [Alyxoria varia]